MSKDKLYHEIFSNLKRQSTPKDVYDLKLRVATVVYDINEKEMGVNGKFGRDTAYKVAATYAKDLELFLRSMAVIPEGYKDDYVKLIVHAKDINCECLFAMLHLFWQASTVAEEFIAKRLVTH